MADVRIEQRCHRVLAHVLQPVVEGEGLDEQHRAVGLEVFAGVAGDADRITHVVETVEEADEVEGSLVALGVRDLESGPIAIAVCNWLRGVD